VAVVLPDADRDGGGLTGETRKGLLFALAAYGFWGLVPIYFRAVRAVPPIEILAHRVVWSVPLVAALIALFGSWGGIRAALRSPRILATLALSATLVATNWFTFIFGVTHDRILETSLGYYINPLVNVVLGMVFLREKLTRLQAVSVLLASAGTLHLAVSYGAIPWISLVVAFTFAFYGLLRKTVRVDSMGGLLVETSLLAPLALGFLLVQRAHGTGAFGTAGIRIAVLLVLAGVVTAVPLIWFASGARRLPYSVIGLCQYVSPSLSFVLAVFLYGERFTRPHAVAFGCIWTALAIFTADMWYRQRRV
jgi:chloramphenicol-sensitive protein RarD